MTPAQARVFKRAARVHAGASRWLRVEIVDGAAAPVIAGEPGGWVYATASELRAYEFSTHRVVVGRDWKPAAVASALRKA